MIEDMTIRKFAQKTQHDYVQRVKDFATYLRRSPEWANPVMGSWRRLDCTLVSTAANPAHHYEGHLRSAISLSDCWNAPRRRCGGTIDSMASSFSVGSPRV
jgi:hypothetical protein